MKTSAFAKFAFLAVMMLAAPAAMASDDVDPAVQEKVKTQLTAQGYDVRKVQMEDGMIEVYAVKDGKTMELYLDDKLNIVKRGGEDTEG